MPLTLPRWDDDRFGIAPDADLLARLTHDMDVRGGAARPAAGWQLPDELVHGSMEELVVGWCGDGGAKSLAELNLLDKTRGDGLLISLFEDYLRGVDHAGLLDGVTLDDLIRFGWRLLDLESLVDFLLISAYFDLTQARPVILEIGGDFGRLIEFIMRVTNRTFRYINIDAVPVSLMYCHEYLRTQFPDRDVRMFDPDKADHYGECDALIVPAWDLESLRTGPIALAVNIESMQEMDQQLVDYYIDYLDKAVPEGGLIFLTNSREHEFIGDWNFPDTWRCLFRHRTVRSWTLDHPTEIFRKTSSSQRPQNLLRAETYRRELAYVRLAKELQPLSKRPFWPHGLPRPPVA